MDFQTRKNIRLQGYDYSQNGAYFVTVCVKDRHHLLWENDDTICRGEVRSSETMQGEPPILSPIGKTIDNEIKKIPEIYENVKIDKYVIMPNHLHMIVLIDGFVKTDERTTTNYCMNADEHSSPLQRGFHTFPIEVNCVGPPCSSAKETPTISRIMKQFKGSISKQIGYTIWQKLFHDHIIRNDEEYNKIWHYIDENPLKWQDDCYY